MQLTALVRALVLFHTDHRREARVANHEYRSLPSLQQEVILQVRRQIRARFHDVLEADEKAGVFQLPPSPGADAAALAAVTICDMGMRVSEWYDGQHKPSASELATLHALRLVAASA